jgi:sialate O-acetylesterase
MRIAPLLAIILLCQSPVRSEVRLPSIISNNMLIQQNEKFTVWGWAAPGETITVEIAGNKATASGDAAGSWSCELPAMPASDKPLEMTVVGKNVLVVKNILVGELWLCAGQSNMGWTLAKSNNGEEEVKLADYPSLRLFVVRAPRARTPQGDMKGAWQICTPKNAAVFSAVAYFFGRHLQKKLNTPVGLIGEGWGGSAIEEWLPRSVYTSEAELAHYVGKIAEDEKAFPALKSEWDKKTAEWNAAPEATRARYAPKKILEPWEKYGGIYNGIVAPLLPLKLAGINWYQGESNVGDARNYESQFRAFIRVMRQDFKQPDIPFLFVQLANCNEQTTDANRQSSLAELRHAQSAGLKEPNTAMIVAVDIGEARNVHPGDKHTVAERLALAARRLKYKEAIEDYCSPVHDSVILDGGRVRIAFRFAEKGLSVQGEGTPKGFALAGSDGKFWWADAVLEGNVVILKSEKVSAPKTVRYAWANNPSVNTYNVNNLPLAPFQAEVKP